MTLPDLSTHEPVPLRDRVSAELIKARSARTLWLLPPAAVLFGPVAALFVGLTGSLDPADTVSGGALTGLALSLVTTAIWGALLVTSEYSSGTIRATLIATPRRTQILGAKALVAGAGAALIGIGAVGLSHAAGRLTIDTAQHPPGEVFPGVFGIAACFPAVALLGLATGFVLRSSVGAVALVAAHVALPQLSAAEAFGELHRWTTLIAPTAVVAKLSQSSDAAPELMGSVGGWPRLALVVAGTAGALLAGRRLLERRDV